MLSLGTLMIREHDKKLFKVTEENVYPEVVADDGDFDRLKQTTDVDFVGFIGETYRVVFN